MKKKLKIILLNTEYGRLLIKPFGYNKFLLPAILFFLSGVTGLWVGILIGVLLDMQWIPKYREPKKPDLTINKFMLAAYVVQMGNTISIISFFELKNRLSNYFTTAFVEKRIAFFNELLKQRIQVDAICNQLNKYESADEKITFIKFLISLSQSENNNPNRIKAIYYIAHRLEIDDTIMKTFHKKKSEAILNKKNNYFQILQVPENVSYSELKKTYYALAKKYHPDVNKNKTGEKELNEKFREIVEAYENIKRMNGWH